MPAPWLSLNDATDPRTAVARFLTETLCGDEADRAVLARLMARFEGLGESDGENVLLQFAQPDGSEETIFLSPAAEDGSPIESLRTLVTKVALSCDGAGGGELSSYPGFRCENFPDFLTPDEEELAEALGDVERDEIIGVFDCAQNLIIGHPTRRNGRGEPALYFVDHENGVPLLIEEAAQLTARQVLLRLFSQFILGEAHFRAVRL